MSGFFELAEDVWADADKRRKKLTRKHGAALGHWLADISQYGAAWQGDVWEWTALDAENHPAFAIIGPEVVSWDYGSSSAAWGGWNKPHNSNRDTLLMVPIDEGDADGRVTLVGVQV